MFQSSSFATVAFTPEELKYWAPKAPLISPFTSTLVKIESIYEKHSILVKAPTLATGQLRIANRKQGWESSLSKARSDCVEYVRTDPTSSRWWEEFIGSPASRDSSASGLFVAPTSDCFRREGSLLNLCPCRIESSSFLAAAASIAEKQLK